MIQKVHVLVMGDVMLDVTTHVTVRGPSPENPNILVVNEQYETLAPGGAANVAANLRSLGKEVVVFGAFGNDYESVSLLHILKECGVKYAGVPANRTTVKNRIISPNGQMLRIDNDGRPNFMRSELQRVIETYEPEIVVCSDYGKGFFDALVHSDLGGSSFAKNCMLVDPPRHGGWTKFGSPRTIFKPNLAQTLNYLALAHHSPLSSIVEIYPRLTKQGVASADDYCELANNLALTLRSNDIEFAYVWPTFGAGGSVVLSSGESATPYYIPATDVNAVDVTGAGDTALAVLAAYMLGKPDMRFACTKATEAATVAVQRHGLYRARWPDFDPCSRHDEGGCELCNEEKS